MRTSRLAALCLTVALPALAHPGHDDHAEMGLLEGLWHLLTQPDHLAMLLGAVAMGVVLVRQLRRRR
jgi:hydrogenase/urease accessory protein HupE